MRPLSCRSRAAALAMAALLPLGGCSHTPDVADARTPAQRQTELGLELAAKGRLPEAIEAFDAALEEEPGHLEAIRGRVDTVRRQGRLPELIVELEERARATPDDPLVHYTLGLARFASGAAALEPALVALRRAVELAPKNPEFPLRLGVALLEAERYAEARGFLEQAVALEPGRARSYLPLGICHYKLGDRPKALTTLAQVLEHDPDPRDVQLAARTVDRMYDPFRGFPQLLAKELEEVLVWVERADLPRQALDKLEPMIEKFPDLAVLHALAGLCYERLDDAGRAIDSFRRAAELSPDDPRPPLYLADLYHTKEKLDVAAGLYAEVTRRNPFSGVARRRLGEYALNRGDAREAIRNLQVTVWLAPESMEARLALARALVLGGERARATDELTWVTQRDGSNLEAWMQLGLLLLERREASKDRAERRALSERAAEAFEKVLDKQPQNAAAARALATSQAE